MIALAPRKGLVWGYKEVRAWLLDALARRLHGVPLDRVHTPPADRRQPAA